jgi:lysozyme
MKTSAKGIAAIEQREGSRTRAYQDSVGIWTIGVGHTSAAGFPRVTPGMVITQAQVDSILAQDLHQFEDAVNSLGVTLADHEFDALVSLAFNIGAGAFRSSTVARRLKAGDKQGAADAFTMWEKAGGRVIQGLIRRRASEITQFHTPYAGA